MKITASKMIRATGLAAVLAGLMFVLIQPLHPADVLPSVTDSAWALIHYATLVMLLLFVVGVTAALLYAASVDLGLLRLPHITWVRQTPGSWPCSMGHYPGIFAWGFDLGLGVTTRIPYQTTLVVPLAALLCGDLATAVAITTVYGAARALAVVAAVESVSGTDYAAACDVIQERVTPLKRLVGVTALVIAALIVIS